MRQDRKYIDKRARVKVWPHGIMLILVAGVLILSILAFINPIAHGATGTPPAVTQTESSSTQSPDQTATQEYLSPPTPDEIGSTNGIIFWSTILILILLIGTLRETIHRKGQ